jgi:hypothetical protein
MKAEFGWDHTAEARILSAFFYGYITTNFLGSILCRIFGAKARPAAAGGVVSAPTASGQRSQMLRHCVLWHSHCLHAPGCDTRLCNSRWLAAAWSGGPHALSCFRTPQQCRSRLSACSAS